MTRFLFFLLTPQAHLLCLLNMMRYLLTALLLLPLIVSAQELHTFRNGEIADADDINSNFSNVDERVKALEADKAVSTPCSQSDLDGRWSIFLHTPLEERSFKCDAYLNSQNRVNSVSCEWYEGLNSQGSILFFPEFVVKSNCQIDISVRDDPESSEVVDSGYLIMTSDHKGLMGFARNIQDDTYTAVNAIKLD